MADGWNAKIGKTPNIGASQLPAHGAPLAEAAHGPDDDRQPVMDTTAFPASAVAQLLLTANDDTQGAATGVFITERVILTAAHAVFVAGDSSTSGQIKSMIVVPGRNGTGPPPFGAAETTKFYVPEMWRQHQLPDFDYALAFVPALPAVGMFRPVVGSDDQLGNLLVRIAGYPVDRPEGTQWFAENGISGLSAGQVAYDIDTAEGQSGAAVAHLQDGEALVVAVHRFGNDNANFGTRITQAVLDDIFAHI